MTVITLKDFMQTVDYRITEGSDYCWECFGSNAYRLDSWNGDQDGHSVSVVFDTRTQVVYQMSAYDYTNQRAYRWTNPDWRDVHDEESEHRGVDANQAWDDVNYVDLDVEEDFLEKAQAIVNEEEYDTRVQIPVDFSDEELLTYMKMAHDRDMTFNEFVEEALRSAIENHQLQELKDEFDRIQLEVDEIPKSKKKKGKK